MSNLHSNLNQAIDQIIESKIGTYKIAFEERIGQLEQQLQTTATNPYNEILQQKEVFELLGIGGKRLKNWVDRGLNEIRIDNRIYYRYSDLMNFIENN